MSPERPLLTIAIPTYNRASRLAGLLECLRPQLLAEHRVELIVSDNASTDDTPQVIASAVDRGLRVHHVRNPSNIGADRNFLQCFQLATGKYFWLLGDDDYVLPGGIDRVLNLFAAEELDIVFCAPYAYRENYLDELQLAPVGQSTEIVEDVSRFVRLVTTHGDFVFISSSIVNKDRLMETQHPPFEELLETNLVQLGWVFSALSSFKKGVFLQIGTIAGAAAGIRGGFNPARVFGINYWKAIRLFAGRDTRLAKVLLNDQLFVWFTRNWVFLRQTPGMLGMETASSHLRQHFRTNPRYWLVIFPLAKLPLGMAKLWTRFLYLVMRFNGMLSNPG